MDDVHAKTSVNLDAGDSVEATEEARHRAVNLLRPGDPQALKELAEFLGDASWRVRKAAVWASDRFVGVSGLPEMLIGGLLSETNTGLRVACSQALLRAGSTMLGPLTAALKTTKAGHRKFIVESLGGLQTEVACDELFAELNDPDQNVAAAAAEALGNIGGPRVIERLRARLVDLREDLLQSTYALAALAKARAKLTFAELRPLLGQKAVSRDLYALLALTGEVDAVDVLCATLEAGAEGHRVAALVALADLAEKGAGAARDCIVATLRKRASAFAFALECLEAESDATVEAAVVVVGLFHDPERSPQLLRACACRPFVARGVSAVVETGRACLLPLVSALDRVDVETRVLILDVLEVMGDASIVTEIAQRIHGFDSRSAEAAIRVLAGLGGPMAVDALIALSRNVPADLSRPLALSLANVLSRCESAAVDRVRTLVDSEGPSPVWLVALGSLADAKDVARVHGALHHRDGEIRRAAVEAALAFGAAFPEESFVLALADEDPAVRALAARGLEAFATDTAVNALLAAVQDPVAWVVAEAVRALGSGHGPAVTTTLMAAAKSTSSPIAIAALQSLFRVNPEQIREVTDHAVRHVDPEVVREALRLTMRMKETLASGVLRQCLTHRSWTVRRAAAEHLASRGIKVPRDEITQRYAAETEPLVREALVPLMIASGAKP
jgi:HEAT repeat protein